MNRVTSPRSAYLKEARGLVVLALPLAGANFGQMLLGAVDTAVVGRLGALELGAAGLGNSVFFSVMVLGMGILMGLDPLVSQAAGAGELRQARKMLWQGCWLATAISIPLGIGIWALTFRLGDFGIDAAAAAQTQGYVLARLWGLFPFLLFVALRGYLQAVGRAVPVLWAALVANVVNLPVSWALVFGDAGLEAAGLGRWGVPALGVAGAGYTSAFCSVLQLGVLLLALRRTVVPAGDDSVRTPSLALLRRAASLGAPVGFTLLAEVGIFALTNIAMGNISRLALAAHQVALTLASGTFMIPLGIGAAASVRVGRAIGAGDSPGAQRAGVVAVAAGVGFMSLGALSFWIFPTELALVITDQPGVVAAAVPLLLIAAVFQLSDGAQAVLAGVLRGAGDTRLPLLLNLAGHYLVGAPIGLSLAFIGGLGARGLWWGLSAGLTFVALTLAVRFYRLSQRGFVRA